MPQFDPSTYPTQLVWLLITFVTLFFVIWRVALPKIVDVRDARQRRVDDDLKKAETLRGEAEAVHAALQKAHADAAAEAQAIHRDAGQEISEARTKLQAETAERLADEISASERRILDEKRQAAETIPQVANDVVRAAVERLVGANVDENEARDAIEATRREAL